MRRGHSIEICLQARRQRIELRAGGSLLARWRHHARAQLADDLLRFLGILLRVDQVEALQRQAPTMHLVAMAIRAVAIDKRRRIELPRCLYGRLCSGHCGERQISANQKRAQSRPGSSDLPFLRWNCWLTAIQSSSS